VTSSDGLKLRGAPEVTLTARDLRGRQQTRRARARAERIFDRAVDAMLAEMERGPSCALDVAEQGGLTLEQVGEIWHVTRERIRQIEERARKKAALALSNRGYGGPIVEWLQDRDRKG
jgi:hypothetical protein